MTRKQKNKKYFKETKGITLIALVVTIIVLLILAGVSISMLSGDNSILNRATDARDKTETSTLKEQAEIIRNAMLIDKTTNNQTLTQRDLVAGIAADSSFAGSTPSGNKVVTKDQRYDINVASDLSITVTPHVDGGDTGTLTLTATQRATESRVAVITVSVPAGPEPTEGELQTKSESELQTMYATAFSSVVGMDYT